MRVGLGDGEREGRRGARERENLGGGEYLCGEGERPPNLEGGVLPKGLTRVLSLTPLLLPRSSFEDDDDPPEMRRDPMSGICEWLTLGL